MNMLILQLSDMHFRETSNVLSGRAVALSKAIQSITEDSQFCLIAVTGDIAFSGQKSEYCVAQAFFKELREKIAASNEKIIIEEVYIPGNHDCDFSSPATIRNMVLKNILQDKTTFNSNNIELIDACLTVQKNFFSFLIEQEKSSAEFVGNAALYYTKSYNHFDRHIRVNCFNTAWMSTLHERQGELLASTWLEINNSENADLVVTLFHHPYNWLEANNGKTFRSLVEKSSDIVMSGHEHVSEYYNKNTIDGAVNEYFEGAVLQGAKDEGSGFNIISINLHENEYKVLTYTWDGHQYSVNRTSEYQPLKRNKELRVQVFENTARFQEWLVDAGAAFTHPEKGTLTLQDIFVYPTLINRSYVTKSTTNENAIASEHVLEHILQQEQILILGSERSGKTTLSKALYLEFLHKQMPAVLIQGELIKSHDKKSFMKLVEKAFQEQYDVNFEQYQQLDKHSRILIIDDLHKCKINQKGLHILLDSIMSSFGKIVCFADDLFEIERITQNSTEADSLLSYKQYEIKQFGYLLRGKLIRRWFELGREYLDSNTAIVRKIAQAENLVNTLIGKNLLPSFPIFILSILQSYEATTNHNTALGSYGYHYEALITANLSQAKSRSRMISLDMLYTYLSKVAYYMFSENMQTIDANALDDMMQNYRKEHKLRFNNNEMLEILESARMISKQSEGVYEFRYKYVYYYFVAKYIEDNLHTKQYQDELRDKIRVMVDRIHVEDYSNIILFLVYLTKDEETILYILSKAKGLYSEYKPCDLALDVEFINNISTLHVPLHLLNGQPQDNRERYQRELDNHEPTEANTSENDGRDIEDETISRVLKINVAFKTLQIMGQILRNFPGALHGNIKFQITSESYLLSLRTLQGLLSIIKEDLQNIREILSEFIKNNTQVKGPDELATRVDELIFWLCQLISYGFIKRVSQAVGSEYLEETYKEVYASSSDASFSLIDMSIKLDHFQGFPDDQILKIYRQLGKNNFSVNILRRMVRDHLYLFPVDYKKRHGICQKLDIKINDPQMLNPGEKRLS